MSKYKLIVKVKVVNQETGAVEDKSANVIANLDAADVSAMRSGLIKVTEGWNAHGIESEGAGPQGAQG